MPFTASRNGQAVYPPYVSEQKCQIALIAVADPTALASMECVPLTRALALSPTDKWIAPISTDPDWREGQTFIACNAPRREKPEQAILIFAGMEPPLFARSCPNLDLCVADCNADSVVSVDEVVKRTEHRPRLNGPVALSSRGNPRGEECVHIDELVRPMGDLIAGYNGA